MKTVSIAPGVTLHCIPDSKFKRTRISIYFITPSRRETATAHALLPLVMERGYADCPDMTELSLKLARLYGASLSLDTSITGANRIFSVSLTGLRDRFALHGEALTAHYTDLLLGVALRPNVKDNCFDKTDVDIEKEMLADLIAAEINDKRIYCLRQAQRKMYEGTPFAVERYGYEEDLPALDGAVLYSAYREMVDTGRVEVFATGCDEEALEGMLRAAFAGRQHAGAALLPAAAMPVVEPAHYVENMDTVQGKLCLLFTLPQPIEGREISVMRVAMSVFGSSPTSRLFMNVREKRSLCYYCATGFSSQSSTVRVDSGVEHANASLACQAILDELEDLVQSGPTEKELRNGKNSIVNTMRSVRDSLVDMENWYFAETVFGKGVTPDQVAQEVEGVTAEEAREMLGRLHLSVVYTIAGLEEEAK